MVRWIVVARLRRIGLVQIAIVLVRVGMVTLILIAILFIFIMSSRRDYEGFPEPPSLSSLHSLFLKNNRNILEEMPIKDVSFKCSKTN